MVQIVISLRPHIVRAANRWFEHAELEEKRKSFKKFEKERKTFSNCSLSHHLNVTFESELRFASERLRLGEKRRSNLFQCVQTASTVLNRAVQVTNGH